mgnify:CR=1 FL=1
MLIGLKHRFIFIANTKSASTTIEHHLQRSAEIAIRHQAYGKHWPASTIEQVFGPYFQKAGVKPESLFRFGVIRDPVEWLVSWFNYRQRPELDANSPRSCRGVDFDDFVAEIRKGRDARDFASLSSQGRRFLDQNGDLAVDYLVAYPRVVCEVDAIAKHMGLNVTGDMTTLTRNQSPRVQSTNRIESEIDTVIRDWYAQDQELYEKALGYGFGDLADVIERKYPLSAEPDGN